MSRRVASGFLAGLVLSGCTLGGSSIASTSSARPTPTPTATPITSPQALNFKVQSVADGLVAPWALAFAADGAIWLTERPGRVRIVRRGQLRPAPALTLSVVTANGCESGLLGIAVKEPNVFLYYTYRGAGGNTNRISRFTIQGDALVSEQVLLGGIPGGTCYHFGGRLKLGPDGWLYATTGEGYVASRAATPSGLSGKILRVHLDGSGAEVFAWGFRNPQGITFDAAGRLYASNNGPTGDLGLCCNDEIDYVQQGGFYGWPEFAATVRTRYGQDNMPPTRNGPIASSGNSTWAPSGITFYSPRQKRAGDFTGGRASRSGAAAVHYRCRRPEQGARAGDRAAGKGPAARHRRRAGSLRLSAHEQSRYARHADARRRPPLPALPVLSPGG